MDGEGAGSRHTDLSAVITATSPIVAERAMYRIAARPAVRRRHDSAGVTAPALEWFLAEGATGTFFDLFVLIANPNAAAATVEVAIPAGHGGGLPPGLTRFRRTPLHDLGGRRAAAAGLGMRPFANASLSMVVRSTNGLPIVVERTMWWPGPALTPNFWYESHNSPGATTTATRWGIAGGDVGGADGAETFVLIANATASAGQVAVRVLTNDGGTFSRTYDIPAQRRTNVAIAADFPAAAAAGVVSVLVESVGATPVPIAVESASYASPGGVVWARGTNALATPLP